MANFEDLQQGPEQEDILIEGARHGDRHASAALVERYWERLYRWLFHLTHNRHTAEDLAQEAYLKAFANLDRFRLGSNFHAWLFRIAYNAFVSQWRGDERARQVIPQRILSRFEDPSEEAMNREALQMLARAVGRLPADFRAAFLLRAEQALSFDAIAQILGIKAETARWRVFKARQKLMRVLRSHLQSERI